jgi:hypothetical protein
VNSHPEDKSAHLALHELKGPSGLTDLVKTAVLDRPCRGHQMRAVRGYEIDDRGHNFHTLGKEHNKLAITSRAEMCSWLP